MSTLIPNANSYIAFATTAPASMTAPTAINLSAAVNLTDFIISLTASFQGNAVPTPKLSSTFETSIPGTSSATFTAEMYRDSVLANDTAWTAMVVNQLGWFYISRFGGLGALKLPITADKVDIWPVRVISRAASALSSNTAQTFTLTCAIPTVPSEGVAVV